MRCPDVAARDAAEFKRPAPPRPPHWPKAGAGDDEVKSHIDTLEATIARKNATGDRVVREHRTCRDGGAAAPATPQS